MTTSAVKGKYYTLETTDDDIAIVTITPTHQKKARGALSEDECFVLREQLAKLASSHERMLINLENVEYVHKFEYVLIAIWKALGKRIGPLRICSASGYVKDILVIMRFSKLIGIHDDRESALQAFRQHTKTETCRDCRGSGQYVGLTCVEACKKCGGKGKVITW